MQYFNTLPQVLLNDQLGNPVILTNILTRAKILEELQKNPLLFYEYSVQEGDTPEIISDKYYGTPYRYWIILYANQILDPIWEWPMSDQQLFDYLDVKYASEAQAAGKTPFEYVTTTVYNYQKITTTTDLYTNVSTTRETVIDLNTYNSLVPSSEIYIIPNNPNVKIDINKNIVYILDHEKEINDSKRQIKIINETFVTRMEEQLKFVMEA